MSENNKRRSYADDCIHLHACRRICKYNDIHYRGCNSEYCSAYEDDLLYKKQQTQDTYTRQQVQVAMSMLLEDCALAEIRGTNPCSDVDYYMGKADAYIAQGCPSTWQFGC